MNDEEETAVSDEEAATVGDDGWPVFFGRGCKSLFISASILFIPNFEMVAELCNIPIALVEFVIKLCRLRRIQETGRVVIGAVK